MTPTPVDGESGALHLFQNTQFSCLFSRSPRSSSAGAGRTEAKPEQPDVGKSVEFVLRAFAQSRHLHQFESGLKRPAAHVLPNPDWTCRGSADEAATRQADSYSPAAVHYVGFRDDRYWNAFRIWGGPRVIHRWWDKRAQRDIGPNDIVIFADGDWRQEPRRFNAPDIDEPTQ